MKTRRKIIIDELNEIKKNMDGKRQECLLLTVKKIQQIAKNFNYSPKEIEIIALNEGILPSRYQKNYNSISLFEQVKLLRSRVAVIGCGGLGGNIIELLARLGVGELIIIDGDKFTESNLNRQILCTEENLGKSKVDAAKGKVKEINSSVKVKTYPFFIDSKNIKEMLQGADLAVDALDNISARFVLEKACQGLEIPLVHGAVDGLNGQVSTIFPQDKGFKLIYGFTEKLNQSERKRVSVLSATPALIASFQVQEVIKILLKKGKPLRNELLFINLNDHNIEILKLDE